MAIKKQKEFSTGQTGEYWKFIRFVIDWTGKTYEMGQVACYMNQEAKELGKKYIEESVEGFVLNIPVTSDSEGDIGKCYEKIMATSETPEPNWFADGEVV